MSPGSITESYPAFAHIGLRENPGKNLNHVTCPNRESNPGHLISRPDTLTVTPQMWTASCESWMKNLVVPPLVAITAATLSGMLSTSLCRISTGMRRHSYWNLALSWTMEVHLPRPQSPVQFVPKVLSGIEIRTLCRPVQSVNIIVCIPLHSSRRNMRPTSNVQPSARLQEEWRRIPVDVLHKLVESMPDRVAAVTATRGGTMRFKGGRESVEDNPRSDRPSSSKTNENIAKVHDIVRSDRRLKIREMVDELSLSLYAVQSILTEDLNMRQPSFRKLLPDEQNNTDFKYPKN
ncbi:hypothetical protein ANN_16756 [Periplaneta americana]|uniref:Uncharacterized protein n=1 Tax=Periplaneta americana TaxID=6978 RepID=A0ABQ8SSC6_PERAM|nr:hypothetical protein ANN_16756 [Periplaneta americana]